MEESNSEIGASMRSIEVLITDKEAYLVSTQIDLDYLHHELFRLQCLLNGSNLTVKKDICDNLDEDNHEVITVFEFNDDEDCDLENEW